MSEAAGAALQRIRSFLEGSQQDQVQAERWLRGFFATPIAWQVLLPLLSAEPGQASPGARLVAATTVRRKIAAGDPGASASELRSLVRVAGAALQRHAAAAAAGHCGHCAAPQGAPCAACPGKPSNGGPFGTALCRVLSALAIACDEGRTAGGLVTEVLKLLGQTPLALLTFLKVIGEDVFLADAAAHDAESDRREWMPGAAAAMDCARRQSGLGGRSPHVTAAHALAAVAPEVVRLLGDVSFMQLAAAQPGGQEALLFAYSRWIWFRRLGHEDAKDALAPHALSGEALRVLSDPSSGPQLTEAAADAAAELGRAVGDLLLPQMPAVGAAYRAARQSGNLAHSKALAIFIAGIAASSAPAVLEASAPGAVELVDALAECLGDTDSETVRGALPALGCLAFVKLDVGSSEQAAQTLRPHLLRVVEALVKAATAPEADEKDDAEFVEFRADVLSSAVRDVEHLLEGAGCRHVLGWLQQSLAGPQPPSPTSVEAACFYLDSAAGYARRFAPEIAPTVFHLRERMPNHWRARHGWIACAAPLAGEYLRRAPQNGGMLVPLLAAIEEGLSDFRYSEQAAIALHDAAGVAGASLAAPGHLEALVRIYSARIAAPPAKALEPGYVPPPPKAQTAIALAVGTVTGRAPEPLPVVVALVTPAGQLLSEAVSKGDRQLVTDAFHRIGALFDAAARFRHVLMASCDDCGRSALQVGQGWYHQANSDCDLCEACYLRQPEQLRAKGIFVRVDEEVDLGCEADKYVIGKDTTRPDLTQAWNAAVAQVLPCCASAMRDPAMSRCVEIVDAASMVGSCASSAASPDGLRPLLADYCSAVLEGYSANPQVAHWRCARGLASSLEDDPVGGQQTAALYKQMLQPTAAFCSQHVEDNYELLGAAFASCVHAFRCQEVGGHIAACPEGLGLLRLAAAVCVSERLHDELEPHRGCVSMACQVISPLLRVAASRGPPDADKALLHQHIEVDGCSVPAGAVLTAGLLRTLTRAPDVATDATEPLWHMLLADHVATVRWIQETKPVLQRLGTVPEDAWESLVSLARTAPTTGTEEAYETWRNAAEMFHYIWCWARSPQRRGH